MPNARPAYMHFFKACQGVQSVVGPLPSRCVSVAASGSPWGIGDISCLLRVACSLRACFLGIKSRNFATLNLMPLAWCRCICCKSVSMPVSLSGNAACCLVASLTALQPVCCSALAHKQENPQPKVTCDMFTCSCVCFPLLRLQPA